MQFMGRQCEDGLFGYGDLQNCRGVRSCFNKYVDPRYSSLIAMSCIWACFAWKWMGHHPQTLKFQYLEPHQCAHSTSHYICIQILKFDFVCVHSNFELHSHRPNYICILVLVTCASQRSVEVGYVQYTCTMVIHECINVLPHANLYKFRWAPLHDIGNIVPIPPLGSFDHRFIEWSSSYCFQNGYHTWDNIEYIPSDCIEDFTKGEECHPNVESKFVRKDVCKHTTLSQLQPYSFIKNFRYGSALNAPNQGYFCILNNQNVTPKTFITKKVTKVTNVEKLSTWIARWKISYHITQIHLNILCNLHASNFMAFEHFFNNVKNKQTWSHALPNRNANFGFCSTIHFLGE